MGGVLGANVHIASFANFFKNNEKLGHRSNNHLPFSAITVNEKIGKRRNCN